jgi:translation initiation factor 1
MRLFEGTAWDRPPTCDRCGKLESECDCPAQPPPQALIPPEKQTARLSLEKRKKGKLPALLNRLKNACGAGGSLDGDLLEIQGDQVDRVRKLLEEIGYKIR